MELVGNAPAGDVKRVVEGPPHFTHGRCHPNVPKYSNICVSHFVIFLNILIFLGWSFLKQTVFSTKYHEIWSGSIISSNLIIFTLKKNCSFTLIQVLDLQWVIFEFLPPQCFSALYWWVRFHFYILLCLVFYTIMNTGAVIHNLYILFIFLFVFYWDNSTQNCLFSRYFLDSFDFFRCFSPTVSLTWLNLLRSLSPKRSWCASTAPPQTPAICIQNSKEPMSPFPRTNGCNHSLSFMYPFTVFTTWAFQKKVNFFV